MVLGAGIRDQDQGSGIRESESAYLQSCAKYHRLQIGTSGAGSSLEGVLKVSLKLYLISLCTILLLSYRQWGWVIKKADSYEPALFNFIVIIQIILLRSGNQVRLQPPRRFWYRFLLPEQDMCQGNDRIPSYRYHT